VLVSAVLFETARVVPGLDELARHCAAAGVELLVDAYHALGALPFRVSEEGLESTWIVGGGYKYLQLGEGNCFLRLPSQAEQMRPVLTGWFAEFELLAAERADTAVRFPAGGARFAGSTYDPTSNYRAARVFAFFEERGLTPELLRASYLHQAALLAARFDELGFREDVMARDRSAALDRFGAFLAIECSEAGEVARRAAEEGVQIDARGRYFRLGPAPYLSDAQLHQAMDRLGAAAAALGLR
jgi:kynureninase